MNKIVFNYNPKMIKLQFEIELHVLVRGGNAAHTYKLHFKIAGFNRFDFVEENIYCLGQLKA